MVGYIAIGVKTKKEAEKEKRKAINSGYKGVTIRPFISYGSKRPYHYDVLYKSINPLIKRVKNYKDRKVITYLRKTPKGIKKVSTDTIYKK